MQISIYFDKQNKLLIKHENLGILVFFMVENLP